jgi:pyridoxamine 5'-phosphate oxidase
LNCDYNVSVSAADLTSHPLALLDRWLGEARAAGAPTPAAMTLVTVASAGRPSARVVSLKRLEADALVFTTGLWTRKAEELRANPDVAAVFFWPSLQRQVRVEGRAEFAERELAEELFAARPRAHQLQTLASRQGDPIEDLEPIRRRLNALSAEDGPVACPDDWGAVRVRPAAVEFWEEGADRLHDRLRFEAAGDGWRRTALAP